MATLAQPDRAPPDRAALSTDVVNRFAEVVMLLDLAVDDPAILTGVKPWRTVTYRGHCEGAGTQRALAALAAYDALPGEARDALDRAIADLDALSRQVLAAMEAAAGAPERAAARDRLGPALAARIAGLQGLIAGSPEAAADPQAAVDDLFG